MLRDELLTSISDHLSRIAHQVEVRNAISLFDLNIAAEDFYMGLLNAVYSTDLINLNTAQANATAIDLGDTTIRQAVQVTSDNTVQKIRETVSKFTGNGLDDQYDELKILMLRRKKRYRQLPETDGFILVVMDHLDLIQDIRRLCTGIDQLRTVWQFLESELVTNSQSRGAADAEILRTFAENASRHIACVAERIVSRHDGELPRAEFEDTELKQKFDRMKCSPSYKRKFDRSAVYFPNVNEIIATDGVDGGATTIKAIVGLIENLYFEVLDQSVNGDRIHNQIVKELLSGYDASQEEIVATEVLVFFTVNECGIFNEVK